MKMLQTRISRNLEGMAFFINDMRLLINIANEYQQYRRRLCATGQISLKSDLNFW